eukprot:2734038-Pleurochrysis_carterae.AAC.3
MLRSMSYLHFTQLCYRDDKGSEASMQQLRTAALDATVTAWAATRRTRSAPKTWASQRPC